MPRTFFFRALMLNVLGLAIFSSRLISSATLRAEEEKAKEKTDQKTDDKPQDSSKKSSEKTAPESEEIKSGLKVGEYIGTFDVVKCAGADDDGFALDKEFCYCCELGLRPVVMVFARTPGDASFQELLARLNSVVGENKDKKLAAFVSLLGPDQKKLRTEAKELGKKSKVNHVALVVPVENENGPEDLNLNPKAQYTIVIYNQGRVKANHVIAQGKGLSKEALDRIVEDTKKILK